MAETTTTPPAPAVERYMNGSDLLVSVGGKCIGHCSEHTISFETESKDRAVKAPEKQATNLSMFKETTITGLGITISFKALRTYEETELSFTDLRVAWKTGTPVYVECFGRPDGSGRKPYLAGYFVITKLTESSPAMDDVSWDGELKLTGAPTTFTGTTTV